MEQQTVRSRRLLWFVGLALLVAVSVKGCSSHPDPWAKAGNKVRVVATFAPLDSFVQKIGGEHVDVKCLTSEEGPHHFDPRAHENITLRGARLFVANGLELDETWADKLKKSAGNPKLDQDGYLKVGDVLAKRDKGRNPKDRLLIRAEKIAGEKDEHGHGDGHDHGEGEYDPHIWFGLASTVPEMIDIIRENLSKVDPEHAEDYKRNAAVFRNELINLHAEAIKDLKGKKDKKLITTHDSLRYLARDLGLNIVGTVELAPGEARGAQKKKELLELCLKEKIKYIALEPNNPKAKEEAEQIKKDLLAKDKDLKVKLIDIDPLETAERKELTADWYREQMKKNIDTLEKELE